MIQKGGVIAMHNDGPVISEIDKPTGECIIPRRITGSEKRQGAWTIDQSIAPT
jgi:hypothetical protein